MGRAEERKGLPVLLRAFEALRGAGVEARLTVAGATHEEVEPLLLERDGVRVLGRVTEEDKFELLGRADVLCAPVDGRRELRHGADRGVRLGHRRWSPPTSPATATWCATATTACS